MADLTSKVISSNFQRLLQIDSGVVQDGTGSAFALRVSGSEHVGINANPRTGTTLNVGGDIIATGDIIAENYIVSSSVTYMTQSFASGSNIFGDSTDDVHVFTGSISASGNIETQGDIHLLNTKALKIENAAGTSTQVLKVDSGDDIYLGHSNFDNIFLQGSGGTIMALQGTGNVGIGTTSPTEVLQVEGNISASGEFITKDGDIRSNVEIDFFNVGGSAQSIRAGGITISESYAAGTVSRDVLETQGDGQESLFGGHLALFSPKRNPKLMIGSVYTSSAHLTVEGDISASGVLKADTGISSSGNISIPDNSILNVGTGDDLQIKHNGSDSFITDTGTGDFDPDDEYIKRKVKEARDLSDIDDPEVLD